MPGVDPGPVSSKQAETRDQCKPKKKITLDIGHSGLGNRIFAVISTVLLAIQTDRVLDIRWRVGKSLGQKYEALFTLPIDVKRSDKDYEAFMYWESNTLHDSNPINELVCNLHFDETRDLPEDEMYQDLTILTDKDLFNRVNEQCDVIYLEANVYFGHLVMHMSEHTENLYDR